MKKPVSSNRNSSDKRDEIIVLLTEQNHLLKEQNEQHTDMVKQQSVIIRHYQELEEQFQKLKSVNEQLVAENKQLTVENKHLKSENRELNEKFQEMQAHYDWLKRQVFGQKGERYVASQDSTTPDLFNADTETDEKPKEKEIAAHTRKAGSNKKTSSKLRFDDDVTTVEELIDIPEEEKFCPETGEQLEIIGYDPKEQLYCVPSNFFRLIIKRPKYALRKKDGTTEIRQRKAEPELIRGSKFHSTFLAYLCVQKYVFHIPLNRIIEDLLNKGVHVSSQALSGLVINLGDKLKPLFEVMNEELFKQKYLFTDDTGGKMLQKGAGKAKNTYVWVYIGGDPSKPQYMLYKHSLGRGHDVPREHLSGFSGTITADAFGGYTKLNNDPDSGILWNGCWDHARRNFEPYASTSKIAAFMMDAIREISMNERECWLTGPNGRLAIRQDVQVPLVEEMFEEMKRVSDKGILTPKNKVAVAIKYMLKNEGAFRRFLTDPNLRIENNTSERGMRKIVLGRANWMFFGSERGAEAGCTIMSFAQTCRNMNISPSEYFEDIFQKLAIIDSTDKKALKQLLPDRWQKLNKSAEN